MSTFKFLHASDIHLDSPLSGLESYEGSPREVASGATRKAFENLIDLARTEEVAFVLIAGDFFDSDWRDYNTGLFLVSQMAILRDAGIKAFLVSGNHDASSQITKSLRLPDNVCIFSERRPETKLLEDCGVAIHGQSFASRAVTSDISAGYENCISGCLNIGLLHTSLNGRQNHDTYAPCSLDGLLSKGYDYWALGHVHAREVVNSNPWVVFSGNSQGRHIRESGPKGCTLVTVEDGQIRDVDHRNTDIIRWVSCEVDARGTTTCEQVLDRLHDSLASILAAHDTPLATRVRIHGTCLAHEKLWANPDKWTNEIRAIAADLGSGRMWVESMVLQTNAEARTDSALESSDVLSGILRAIQEVGAHPDAAEDLLVNLREMRLKLPAELREVEGVIDLDDPEGLSRSLGEARELLLARLFQEGAA